MTFRLLSLCFVLGLVTSGCSDDLCTICERLEECGAINESDIDACVEDLEEYGADDDVVSRCADCVDDNSCGEIAAGSCNAACNEML